MSEIICAGDGGVFKICTKCKTLKPLIEYCNDKVTRDGKTSRCRECLRVDAQASRVANPTAHREKVRKWAAANGEKIADYRERNKPVKAKRDRLWRGANPDKKNKHSQEWKLRNAGKVKAQQKKYREENSDFIAALKKDWNAKNKDATRRRGDRRRQNAQYRLDASIRSGVHRGITAGSKSGRSTYALLDYSAADLKEHLEGKFQQGMSWGNYGKWHIDHKIPLDAHNYQTPDDIDFKRAWALANLQPMWATDNQSKSAKLDAPFQPCLALG